ncbi:MAG: hypothetical protein ACOYB1_08865 [Limnohabitans sp.]
MHMQYYQCIPLDSRAEWQQALEGIDHSFAHTWEHCYAMYLTTRLPTYLFYFELNNIRIICPFTERSFNGYIDIVKPYGFSGFVSNGECPEFQYYWNKFIREKEYVCGYLTIDPNCKSNKSLFTGKNELFQYGTTHVLDLKLSIQDLFNNLSAGRKGQLRDWDKINAELIFDRAALEKFFLANYFDFIRRKKAAAYYYFSMESLTFLLSQENIMMVGAQDSRGIVSVNLFTHTNKSADYFLNTSLPDAQHHSASLVWYGVNYFKMKNIEILNLGGGNKGISDFKKRFGGHEFPLQCLRQIYNKPIYDQLCQLTHVDQHNLVDFFPSYRK